MEGRVKTPTTLCPCHEGMLGELIFNLGGRWWCVVNFTPAALQTERTPGKTAHGLGACETPRFSLDALENPAGNQTNDFLFINLVTILLEIFLLPSI